MRADELFAILKKNLARRERHVWIGGDRAHVELSRLDSGELVDVARILKEEAARHPEILWAEVHQGTSRAVICGRKGELTRELALALVIEAELRAGVHRAELPRASHPMDRSREEQHLLELIGEAIGMLIGTGLLFSIIPKSRSFGLLASVLTAVRNVPRLRRKLDERFGFERVDLVLGLLSSLALGPAQRPLQNLVGIVEHAVLGSELAVRRRLFESREAELGRIVEAPPIRPRPERPVPLPPGPIEEYSDRAWAIALGSFGFSLLSTRSVQRAFGALFGAIPRPAQLGREVFVASAHRFLAARRMLVLDDQALRILDRVDCLVIEGGIVPESKTVFGRVEVAQGRNEERLLAVAKELFDPENPLRVARRGVVALGPVGALGLSLDPRLKETAEQLASGGEVVLGLAEEQEVVLLIEVRMRSRVGIEELVALAHEAEMRVIVATGDREILQTIPADDTLLPGEDLWRGVRQLQRDGHVVCVLSHGDSRALDVADLGIALLSPGKPVPWSAHVIAHDDLDDVRALIEAARGARLASRQSVKVALVGAGIGAVASAGGILPLSGGRVLTIVHLGALAAMANSARLYAELVRRQLPPARDPTPWHALAPTGALTRLGSSLEGLTQAQVIKRSPRRMARPRPVLELLSAMGDELLNPLVPLLAAGAGVSAAVGSTSDALMITGTVALNAAIGGYQRYYTERAVRALQRGREVNCLALRDGRTQELRAEQLVVGDVILLARGDAVPADCRILTAEALEVDASGLTGESLPVVKSAAASFAETAADRSSMLYAGTVVTSGKATAVVVATGTAVEARRGSVGVRSRVRETGVERRLRELMDMTAPVALFAGAGVVGTGILRGRKMSELISSAVSLAVASVPEGLPLLATAAELAAARRLSRHGAIVRNVRALESLGRADTLCLDKTGTVTEGSVELREVLADDPDDALALALLASPLRVSGFEHTDPIERALHRRAESHDQASFGVFEERRGELPFEANRTYSAAYGKYRGRLLFAVKGAPEAIFSAIRAEDAEALARAREQAEELARSGRRVLAVARKWLPDDAVPSHEDVRDLELVGLLSFHDPIRKSARRALEDLRRAGLRSVLVTGDHPSTARAVAIELGISVEPYVVTGAELSVMSDDELNARAGDVDIFARVVPSQKVRVVRALTRAGRTVAMVGDGANDAPAIRLASVGIAIGARSAQAAQNAADIVLTEPKIETLLEAVVEGRALWDAVKDAVSILVGGNLGEIGFTLGAGLVSGRPPLSPRQLLLVNLFTDVAPAMAIAVRPPKAAELKDLLAHGPEASLGVKLTRDIGSRAAITALGTGAAWSIASLIGDRRGASTTALLSLVGTQLGQTLSSGDENREVVVTSLVTLALLGMVVQTPIVSGMFGCRPLGPVGLGIAFGSSLSATLIGRYAPDLFSQEGIRGTASAALNQAPLALPPGEPVPQEPLIQEA